MNGHGGGGCAEVVESLGWGWGGSGGGRDGWGREGGGVGARVGCRFGVAGWCRELGVRWSWDVGVESEELALLRGERDVAEFVLGDKGAGYGFGDVVDH